MVDHRGTLTGPEHEVLVFLEGGPADLGPRTLTTTAKSFPSLYQLAAPADGLAAATKEQREVRLVRTVEAKVARRLAKAGWVLIDAGGTVTLRAHRLAKPLAGQEGDGHAVVCSCGTPFDSWADAEAHQALAETDS